MKKFLILFSFLFFATDLSFSQNVGIGIINPTRAKLEVNGAVDYTAAIFGGESTGISIVRNNPGIGFNNYYNGGNRYIANGYSGAVWLDAINGAMFFDVNGYGTTNTFATAGVNSMVINHTGNVSIRTYQTTNASLYVAKAGNTDGSAVFAGTNYASYFNNSTTEDTYIRAGKNNGTVYINDISGGKVYIGSGSTKVAINTTNPVGTLEVREVGEHGLLLSDPDYFFNYWEMRNIRWLGTDCTLDLDYNGTLRGHFNPDDGEYSTFSDSRLKTNVTPMPSLLNKVMQLRPVNYERRFDNPTHKTSFGFIAQDVELLFPELVSIAKDSTAGYKNIADVRLLSYSRFGVLAIKAVQEQQQEIEELKKEINELRQLIRSKQ